MKTLRQRYPFSAIVGQEELKQALLLNLIYPGIGGVLIRGEKGTRQVHGCAGSGSDSPGNRRGGWVSLRMRPPRRRVVPVVSGAGSS